MDRTSEPLRNRILILTPTGRDAQLACGILQQHQLRAETCVNLADLRSKLEQGAATAVIGDEALNKNNLAMLGEWVKSQPPWSDFPFIILTGGRVQPIDMRRRLDLFQPLGNVTLLERPLQSITLLTVVKSALRARLRQYEVEQSIEDLRRADTERSNARAREDAALAQVELLNHIGEILSAELNLNSLLQAITDAGTNLSGADLGLFYREEVDEKARRFSLGFASGVSADAAALALGELAQIGQAEFADRHTVRWPAPDGSSETRGSALLSAISAKLYLRSCLAIPVSSRRGVLFGVLLFGHRVEGQFNNRDERVLSSLAAQAAIAIENAHLFAVAEQERRRLEAARQALQRSNDELRQFAYVASHDLQEPLRTVAGFTELLVDRFRDQAGPDAEEYVHFIVEGVERMSALIRDLLEYSHTGVSHGLPEQPNSVEAAMDEVLFVLAASIQESGAVITHDPLPEVWLESRSLVQLLQNLIGNAIKYRSDRALTIHISAEESGDDWIFSVRDNGIGIADEYRERIFGIFKRLHGKEIPGTGIGLAICQRIVEWHGGRIWVESELGRGSVFRFTVPREPHSARDESGQNEALTDTTAAS